MVAEEKERLWLAPRYEQGSLPEVAVEAGGGVDLVLFGNPQPASYTDIPHDYGSCPGRNDKRCERHGVR